MNEDTLRIQAFAARLVAHVASEDAASGTGIRLAVRVCEQMRPHLATLMGDAGVNALLARALTLAVLQVPWLCSVSLNADGCFDGFIDLEAQVSLEEIAEGGDILVAHLLGLLVTFIGELLTLRIVRQVWQQLPFDVDFGGS